MEFTDEDGDKFNVYNKTKWGVSFLEVCGCDKVGFHTKDLPEIIKLFQAAYNDSQEVVC